MKNSLPDEAAAPPRVTVYYDGACPLCSREIGAYRRMRGANQLSWIDVSREETPLGPGLSRAQALARFHVRTDDGALISGGSAFVRLWASLPGLRWLAALASRPPLSWALEPAYRLFLRLRPWLARRPADGSAM